MEKLFKFTARQICQNFNLLTQRILSTTKDSESEKQIWSSWYRAYWRCLFSLRRLIILVLSPGRHWCVRLDDSMVNGSGEEIWFLTPHSSRNSTGKVCLLHLFSGYRIISVDYSSAAASVISETLPEERIVPGRRNTGDAELICLRL